MLTNIKYKRSIIAQKGLFMNFKKIFGKGTALLMSFVMLFSITSPMVFAVQNVEQSPINETEGNKIVISTSSPTISDTEKAEQSHENGAENDNILTDAASTIVNVAKKIEQSQADDAKYDKLHYVSLGASNTNGYGHHGYLDHEIYEDPLAANKSQMNDYGYDKAPANAYPTLIKDELMQLTGRDVELHQLAISSMRVEEVLWLLDDTYEPDEYMEWRFTGGKSWFDMAHKTGGREALRAEYRDYIANADVITVDLGWNNFGVYAFNNTMTILKEDGARYWKAPDLESVIGSCKSKAYYAIRDKVIECLIKCVDLSDTVLSEENLARIVSNRFLDTVYSTSSKSHHSA
jgi:hypothetical protein